MSDVQPQAPAPSEKLELPEVSMVWRRVFTLVTVAFAQGLLAYIVFRTPDPNALRDIGLGEIVFAFAQSAFYMAAASMSDWQGIAAAVNVKRFLNLPGAS